tara:strand:+ start:107 stop:271 length:165 start_codon:yes stop_codon:yes gene_type:complete
MIKAVNGSNESTVANNMAPINRTIKNTAPRVFCELIIAYSPFSKHETIIGEALL